MLLFATTTALLLVFLPSADMLAFGLHEHLAGAPENTLGPVSSDSMQSQPGQNQPSSHHCELSVSSGDLVAVAALPMPVAVLVFTLDPLISAPQHRPFVLLAPPRS